MVEKRLLRPFHSDIMLWIEERIQWPVCLDFRLATGDTAKRTT